jgi:hypothetical protein
MTFYLEGIKLDLTQVTHGLRLDALDSTWPLPGQTPEETKRILSENFEVVRQKYADLSAGSISPEDLHEVCLHIAIYYFFLYNSWKYSNPKHKDRSLSFPPEDFTHPYTYDKIIHFFKLRYPDEYAAKSAILLDMTPDAVVKYEADRHAFYASFR